MGARSFGIVAALGAAAGGLVAAGAAQAETLRATYALSIIGVPIGIWTAYRQYGVVDYVASVG